MSAHLNWRSTAQIHMDTQGGNVADLENGLERLNDRFSGAVSSSVPVEIVDAGTIEQTTTVLGEASESGNLSHEGNGVEISMEMEGSSHELATLAQVDEVQRISQRISEGVPVDATQLTPSISGGIEVQDVSDLHVPVTSGQMDDAVDNAVRSALPTSLVDGGNLEQQLQQVSQSAIQHFQEVSRSLRSEGIEISPEAIASNFHQSLADSLAAVTMVSGGTSQSSTCSSVLESAINHSTHGIPIGIGMNYSDLEDVNRVINSGIDPNLTVSSSMANAPNPSAHIHTTSMDNILNDSNVPSSPESNFDTADLLNTTLAQEDEVTTKLASSGPAGKCEAFNCCLLATVLMILALHCQLLLVCCLCSGMAAAAAILSGSRKRKRHSFESNPALRKRQCSKLLRRLKETIEELSTRVGLQSCVVTYKPSFKNDKPDPSFKVFGTSPLTSAVEQQKDKIVTVMEEQLQKQPPESASKPPPSKKEQLFDLPPLVFDGIPTPVNEMTQAQLRCFIPNMMKFSTGRGKPGWGKPEMKPQWWPDDIPWQNVRSDSRHESMKKTLPWTEALRKIIIACYAHHSRTDLLPNFNSKNQEESVVQAEMVTQQQQLLHQGIGLVIPALQQTIASTNGEGSTSTEGVSTLAEVATNQVTHGKTKGIEVKSLLTFFLDCSGPLASRQPTSVYH